MIKKILKDSEKGQAIILIAFAIIGLVAIVGLMTDSGMLLVEYARLKRGIDAAAIGAAQQFRKDFTGNDLATAGQEFLRLNQSDAAVTIFICDPEGVYVDNVLLFDDASLCSLPRRKLVRVEAAREVPFGFLRVLGIDSTTITASSIGEAASIDVVLAIDTSASMAYETERNLDGTPKNPNQSDWGDDPALCNDNQTCEPLESVKSVALDFIDTLFFPYDRVAIVTMTSQTSGGFRDSMVPQPLSDDLSVVQQAIRDIKVFEPSNCNTPYGPCLLRCTASEITDVNNVNCYGRNVDDYYGQFCPVLFTTGNPSSCNSSNIGGILQTAGSEFARPGLMREDSFWVVIALAGGPANATDGTLDMTDNDHDGYPDDPLAFGWCPSTTWSSPVNPFCRDALASTRHKWVPGNYDPLYDAEDFARDKADWLADPVDGNGVTVFTIGLGSLVQHAPKGDPDAGEQLLRYIAENAGDTVDPFTGVITVTANHGFYRYSPDTSGLAAIFAAIAENILTRISQ